MVDEEVENVMVSKARWVSKIQKNLLNGTAFMFTRGDELGMKRNEGDGTVL